MSFPSILIGVVLLLATILIVAGPLMRKKRGGPLNRIRNSRRSRRNYQGILLALRDLDFDHQLGVVAEVDYGQLRAQLLAEAAEAHEQTTTEQGDLDKLIEAAVRDRRRRIPNDHGRCADCGADLDPADRYCAACGASTSSECPHCNQVIEPDDKFCAHCGTQLAIANGVTV